MTHPGSHHEPADPWSGTDPTRHLPPGGTAPLPARYPGLPTPAPAQQPVPTQHLLPAQLPIVAQIGDIQVTPTTVRTPIGEFPLRGSTWETHDQWVATQRTPPWAIVCAVLGFFCLTVFSLLFLLAKETTHSAVVHVTVRNGRMQYDTHIPIADGVEAHYLHQQINYVRSLAAR
jgi:hypothetical protein